MKKSYEKIGVHGLNEVNLIYLYYLCLTVHCYHHSTRRKSLYWIALISRRDILYWCKVTIGRTETELSGENLRVSTNTASNYYLIVVASYSLILTSRRNLIAIASLVSFNVFSQNIFLTVFASHGCIFTDRINMFLDEQWVKLSIPYWFKDNYKIWG